MLQVRIGDFVALAACSDDGSLRDYQWVVEVTELFEDEQVSIVPCKNSSTTSVTHKCRAHQQGQEDLVAQMLICLCHISCTLTLVLKTPEAQQDCGM
jgi:hypothetical protein